MGQTSEERDAGGKGRRSAVKSKLIKNTQQTSKMARATEETEKDVDKRGGDGWRGWVPTSLGLRHGVK